MIEFPIHYAEVETIYSQSLGAGYRTLSITSATKGEGKTTLAEALVRRAELIGKKVLLVEMNTFNPVLSEKLRALSSQPYKDNEIVTINDRSFSFLPAPTNLKSLIKYREGKLLLESVNLWLNDFDCIIFDTAPLAALNQSNVPSEIICEVCDGTILVIEAGKTPANMIQESIEKLKVRNVNLIGSVINDKSNPSLLTEISRETERLNRFFPKLMCKVREKLTAMVLLNVSI